MTSKSERRRHQRFPIADGLMEPITLEYAEVEGARAHTVPAILTNLSAGGMSLVTFAEPPHTKEIQLKFHIPGFNHCQVTAKILRIHSKGQVYALGLTFITISRKDESCINKMALDFNDCETRISLGLPEACIPDCHCHSLCSKPQKAPHWPPRV